MHCTVRILGVVASFHPIKGNLPFRVGVGRQRRSEAHHSLPKLEHATRVFSLAFFAVTMMVIKLDHFVRGGQPEPRAQRGSFYALLIR